LVHARHLGALTLVLCASVIAQGPESRTRTGGATERVHVLDVVDGDGSPVADARVTLYFGQDVRASWLTDDGGRVRLPDASEGLFAISVETAGFRRVLEPFDAAPDRDAPVRIVLRRAAPLDVRVVDDAEAAVRDVDLSAALESNLALRFGGRIARSTARLIDPGAGVFRFDDLPEGPLTVLAAGEGHESVATRLPALPTAPITLRMMRRRRYAVTVVEAATGRPIWNARVAMLGERIDRRRDPAKTSCDGRVALYVDRDVEALHVSADGFAPDVVELDGRSNEFVVALPVAGDIRFMHDFDETPDMFVRWFDTAIAVETPDGSWLRVDAWRDRPCPRGIPPEATDCKSLSVATGRRTLFVSVTRDVVAACDECEPPEETAGAFAPQRWRSVFRADVDVRARQTAEIRVPRPSPAASVYLTATFPRTPDSDDDAVPSCTVVADGGRPLALVPCGRGLLRAVDRASFDIATPFDDGRSPVVRGLRTLVVAPGTYDLTVAFPGCAPQTRRLALRAGERTSVAFELAAERK
jgi:hypothetical protein